MSAAHPVAPATESEPAVVEILDAWWERIQLHLRLRPCDGPLDISNLWLHSDTRPQQGMPPTGVRLDGMDLVIRFNVMQGPGQVPLSPGRWRLGSRSGHAVVRFALPDARVRLPGATFPFSRVEYVVAPMLDEAAGSIVVDVDLEPMAVSPDEAARESRVAERLRHTWKPLRATLFRLLLAICRGWSPRNGRRILFTSNSRPELGGNLRIVWDRFIERGLDRDYELHALFKPGITARRSLRDRLRMPWLLGRADVILLDDYHPVVYGIRDREVSVIQLWHAFGAFKTFDYSRIGKPGAPSPYQRDHKNYTFVTVSSDEDIPFYAEAFGVPEERVVPTGIPRMDEFVATARRPEIRERSLERFPEAAGRMTILFAPTFRGSGGRTATYDLSMLDYTRLHELCVRKNAVLIIRMHPHIRLPLGIPEEFGDRLIEERAVSADTPDLLYGADLLITDYSSILFEYAALHRPMLFYAYDLDEYRASRDFYVDYEAFVPGRIVRTFDELVDAITDDDYQEEKVEPFAARYLRNVDGQSTDRIIDLILKK